MRRARQIRAISAPSASRPGTPSCRKTTPHSHPPGIAAITASGSGKSCASVNSQSTGTESRFTLRPQLSNPWSMPELMTISQNLANIHARITATALAAGRDPAGVTLVAVSKTQPQAAVLAALAAGQTVFGENRVQEAAEKFPLPGARLHLIGGLQSNKAAEAVRLADRIESLDREKLSDALLRAAEAVGKIPELLVQVNIGDEAQKSGVPLGQADAFIRAAKQRFGAALQGLMCIPPLGPDPLPFFQMLAALADTHALPVRSMGMSGDFEAAIAAGATHVRIGTAIFGHR
jgi:PLP dependent protein